MKAFLFSGLATSSAMIKGACFAMAVALFVPADEAQADNRRGFDSNRGFDRAWNREHRGNNNASWRRNVDKRDHRDNRSSVSVNLNFGHVSPGRWRTRYHEPAPKRFNNSAFGNYPFSGSYPFYRNYNTLPPVVIYQNNVIAQPSTIIRSKSYSTRQTESSLLREINGRCFERSIDKRGVERRTELPPAACNF